jgi:hypothetical protein
MAAARPVHRLGDLVLRERRPWSETVVRLRAHLREGGFTQAPVPVRAGFAPDGHEQLAFIPGDAAPACWTEPAIFEVGRLLRRLHDTAANFPRDGVWMPWWGRHLETIDLVIGHCDAAPWNFLAEDSHPLALLDWDSAGPVGREWDVAQTAWLNAQLHDDVAERQQLPDASAVVAEHRARTDAEVRAHGLREMREEQGLTQLPLAVVAANCRFDNGVPRHSVHRTSPGVMPREVCDASRRDADPTAGECVG